MSTARQPWSAAYLRLSYFDIAACPLETQQQTVQEAQAQLDVAAGPIISEHNVVAYRHALFLRPEGRKLLDVLRCGDTLILYNITRVWSEPSDMRATMDALLLPRQIRLVVLQPPLAGVWQGPMLNAVAQAVDAASEIMDMRKLERRRTLERIAKKVPMAIPKISCTLTTSDGKKEWLANPATKALVERICREHDGAGKSFYAIARDITKETGRLHDRHEIVDLYHRYHTLVLAEEIQK